MTTYDPRDFANQPTQTTSAWIVVGVFFLGLFIFSII